MNENTETQYDYERLKKVVCEQINNTLKDNFLYTKTGENQWEYNMKQTTAMSSVKKISLQFFLPNIQPKVLKKSWTIISGEKCKDFNRILSA